jgi:hypothetical protein
MMFDASVKNGKYQEYHRIDTPVLVFIFQDAVNHMRYVVIECLVIFIISKNTSSIWESIFLPDVQIPGKLPKDSEVAAISQGAEVTIRAAFHPHRLSTGAHNQGQGFDG